LSVPGVWRVDAIVPAQVAARADEKFSVRVSSVSASGANQKNPARRGFQESDPLDSPQ
jgi:hypothetical protein